MNGKPFKRRSLIKAAMGLTGTALMGCKGVVRDSINKAELKASQTLYSDLLDYDAVGLAQLVKNKQVSQLELIDAAIERIERLDGKLNAMTTRSFERAYQRTKLLKPNSVFAGVPVVLKDLVDVAGIKRTNGSRLTLNNVPKTSVEYVKAMEAGGLNILGMTNTPEFASLALTDNDAFGPTRNPWNLSLSAGGSSGGSAAAVAAGYVPLAHGTDGGGSNRIPAACCGLFGMKPSRYRQVSGEANGEHQFLRTHQCISRSVRDSAALLSITENRRNSANYSAVGLVTDASAKRLRIAFTMENNLGELPTKTVQEALQKTAILCESLGHIVEDVENPVNGGELTRALEQLMLSDMPLLLERVEKISGKSAAESGLLTKALIDLGQFATGLKPDAKQQGVSWFTGLTRQLEQAFFSQYDVWLTPTMLTEAPEIGFVGPNTSFELARTRNHSLMSYTALANGIGAPAMSVPLFTSTETGLPIGSQFLAAAGNDKLLYQLAFELEQSQPWSTRWAPISAKFL